METKSEKYLACEKFLQQLPEGYRERALAQMDAKRIESKEICESLLDAIRLFSQWAKTKEGGKFWDKVDDHYIFCDRLPPLPTDTPNDLSSYKASAEEDYDKTPISVLRYIEQLENNNKK